MQHDAFEPSFVVDVTAAWDRKLAALRAYRSQLHQTDAAPDERPAEPVTKVSTPEFSLVIEGRARHFGGLIGAAFGEPFWSRGPLAVSDLFTILPGGVR
jgi:N-acetylglucosamine malate deacetylase 1